MYKGIGISGVYMEGLRVRPIKQHVLRITFSIIAPAIPYKYPI